MKWQASITAAAAAAAVVYPLAAASTQPGSPVISTQEEVISYVVRKHENLYTLAESYFTKTEDYSIVRKINHIKDPHRLLTGRSIRIPTSLLRQVLVSASLEAFSGPVKVRIGGKAGFPALGMQLGETSEIQTGVNAFVTLRLPDASTVTIPSLSRIRIARLRRTMLSDSVERQFDVGAGRVTATVTPMVSIGSSFRVTTPLSVAAVRGTEFRVSYEADQQRSTSEVLHGKVLFSAYAGGQPQDLLITAGTGSSTSEMRNGPTPLLPPPGLLDTGKVQSQRDLHFSVSPVAAAAAYRVQIAHDAGFLDLLAESRSASAESRLPPIPDGTYFARVTAIDAGGLEGSPATFAFERDLNIVSASMEQKRLGRHSKYLFKWNSEGGGDRRYRFQLSLLGTPKPPLVDEDALAVRSLVVTDLPAGDYQWQVMALKYNSRKIRGVWTPVQQFHVERRR